MTRNSWASLMARHPATAAVPSGGSLTVGCLPIRGRRCRLGYNQNSAGETRFHGRIPAIMPVQIGGARAMAMGIRRVTWNNWIIAPAAASVLAFAVCGPAAAQSTKPWRHVIIQPKSDAGILMMPFKRGFADKMGLPVQLITVKDDELALKAVISGEAESYEGGPAAAMLADAHGSDVKVVGCTWITMPHGIFAHNDITTIEQLKGKSIAVATPGSLPDIFARGALAKHNIPVSSVNLASLGGDLDRYRALTARVVDAAVVSAEVTPLAE